MLAHPFKLSSKRLLAATTKCVQRFNHSRSTQRILSLFDNHGSSEYIGEPMTIESHSLQAAAVAADAGEDSEGQLAALLHDVGHLLGLEAGGAPPPPGMDGCGTVDHEGVGATFLRDLGFSDTVSFVCQNHVTAKRYLCTKDPEYERGLTDASRTTLHHQGGLMTEEECTTFEAHPAFDLALRMRNYDEAAKDPTRINPLATEYIAAMEDNLTLHSTDTHTSAFASTYVLSPEQLRQWDIDGFLVIKNPFTAETSALLSTYTDDTASLPKGTNQCFPWLVHHEMTAKGDERLARVENFCGLHKEWNYICREGEVASIVSQAFGKNEKAVLFKDKINFKLPGGAGFLCHQDATAFAVDDDFMAKYHITAMIAIDESTVEKGCLQVAPHQHRAGLLDNTHGVTNKDVEESMEFVNVLCDPGDVVIFDSFIPHRSGFNTSDASRRSIFLTYNMESDGGDCHSRYYAAKAARAGGDISINKDFAGEIV
jgi:predicted HD phosphohydrolase